MPLIQSNAKAQAVALLQREVRQAEQDYRVAIAALIDDQGELMKKAGSSARQQTGLAVSLIVGSGLVGLLFAVGIGLWIASKLFKQLGGEPAYAAAEVRALAQGEFERQIQRRSGDDSRLLAALKAMQSSFKKFANAQMELARAHRDGWIWQTMDASQYRGSFATMATEINE